MPTAIIALITSLLLSRGVLAVTPPGTVIRSQAQASFMDGYGEKYLVTSNQVTTLIQAVTGALLESEQHLWGMKGKELIFPHLLTNSGNISARYELTTRATILRGEKRKQSVKTTLYKDLDHDGQPKEKYKITGPVFLPAGGDIGLLIKTTVPDEDFTEVKITARVDTPMCQNATGESARRRCLAVNTNLMSRSKGVVYEVSLSTDKQIAYIGDDVKTTLSFIRQEKRSYQSAVTMMYQLPEMLIYKRGSSQLCSYSGAGCRQLPDPQETEAGLKFKLFEDIDQVGHPESRHEGQVRFKTTVVGGVSEILFNVAEYTFCEKDRDCSPGVLQKTNYVPLAIKGYGVSLNGSPLSPDTYISEPLIVASAPPGGRVEFTSYLWNRGTEATGYLVTLERSDNTFPAGSRYCLTSLTDCYDFSELPAPLVFKKGDVSPGGSQAVRLLVQLPASGLSSSLRSAYSLTLKAVDTGTAHSYEVSDTVRNMLLEIVGPGVNSMDLTLDQPVNDNSPGKGPGPETVPLNTLTGKPGSSLVFDAIYINNTGEQADNYQLELQSGSGDPLPESFTWSFLNAQSQPVASSVTVPGGSYARVKVLIELPADSPPLTRGFYFRAYSLVTGSSDSLHLALTVAAEEQLALEPDGQAQVMAGSSVTFSHQLTNLGNVDVNDIFLTLSNSHKDSGWQATVYADLNRDGLLTGNEPVLDSPFTLSAGATHWLIVKLFAPANAPPGETNITTLTASWGEANTRSIADTASVSSASVIITRMQAPWDCNEKRPEQFFIDPLQVQPGSCVVYQLMATNQGSDPVHNVVVHNRLPDFTWFQEGADLPFADHYGQILTSGETISAFWNSGLQSGQSVFLLFGVKIQ